MSKKKSLLLWISICWVTLSFVVVYSISPTTNDRGSVSESYKKKIPFHCFPEGLREYVFETLVLASLTPSPNRLFKSRWPRINTTFSIFFNIHVDFDNQGLFRRKLSLVGSVPPLNFKINSINFSKNSDTLREPKVCFQM